MVNLKQYKNFLINKFNLEADNLNYKRILRKINLESSFSDEDLINIIYDTYSFANDILKNDTINDNYCKIPVDGDVTKELYLGLLDKQPSDLLFYDSHGRIISKYVAKKIFGNDFCIDLVKEKDNNDYYICMQEFPNDIYLLKNEINILLEKTEETKKLLLNNKIIKY